MTEPIRVGIWFASPDARPPFYATDGSAGFDLCAAESKTIAPGEIALISTGLVFAVPQGYFLAIVARSSTPKRHGVDIPNAVGVLDSDYHGADDVAYIQVRNFTDAPQHVVAGTRLAQGLILPVPRVVFETFEAPDRANRGGFGSTGL
jgi:dUTP pyrophosphatase